jgi:hypothetical protein
MDPVQALGITLHKLAKKIHYVLGRGEGRLVLGGALGESKALAGWTIAPTNQPPSPENPLALTSPFSTP